MNKARITAAAIAVLLMVLCFSSCGLSNTKPSEKSNIYRFESYKSKEVFDIQKVKLSKDLDKKCKSYKFTYLSDGLKIKAYISVPLAAVKSQNPTKCVLYNRGGNRDFSKLEDDTTAVICAACNRVVVGSQYRGADGSDGADEFGGNDINDVLKLIDLCEKNFSFIDMDDFCVAGVSRGGMMTYLAAKHDSRVKRIIAVSAVSDLFESYKNREDMRVVMTECIGFTPKENPDEYKKRSAIYWYDEIKIPVLMIHCKLDRQVSYLQAKALYKKLKNTTDCTFISHDDDVHGVHKEDFKAINDWLNK